MAFSTALATLDLANTPDAPSNCLPWPSIQPEHTSYISFIPCFPRRIICTKEQQQVAQACPLLPYPKTQDITLPAVWSAVLCNLHESYSITARKSTLSSHSYSCCSSKQFRLTSHLTWLSPRIGFTCTVRVSALARFPIQIPSFRRESSQGNIFAGLVCGKHL